MPFEHISPILNIQHLSSSQENHNRALNKPPLLLIRKLLRNKLRSFTQLDAIREDTLEPSLLKLWIFIKQLKNSLTLNLHNFRIGHRLDIRLRVLLIDEIVRIYHAAYALREGEIIELLLHGACDDEIDVFHVFVFGLDCCAFCEQPFVGFHADADDLMGW